MKTLHDRTVEAIADAIRSSVPKHEFVYTKVEWQPMEDFPECLETLDVVVVSKQPSFDGTDKRPFLGWLIALTTVIDVVDGSTFEADFIDRPNLLMRTAAHEHLLFDPTGDLMRPQMQGFRTGDEMERLTSCNHGVFYSSGKYRLDFLDGRFTAAPCDTYHEERAFDSAMKGKRGVPSEEIRRVIANGKREAKRLRR